MPAKLSLLSVLLLCAPLPALFAQPPAGPLAVPQVLPPAASPTYILGPDDQLVIRVLYLEEIPERPFRVDMAGNINVPLVGRLHVAGLTLDQTEAAISQRLQSVLQEPEVTVLVAEPRSHPISVLGAVKTPGVQQLTGRKTLTEVLSMAGGASPDAGNTIMITRRKESGPIPLPGAALDPSQQFYVAKVNLKSLTEARNPQENIVIVPEDVVSLPKGELVYVVGAVPRAGGFVLNERESLSILQAISLAGGLDRFANAKNVMILRPKAASGNREEILVDLKSMLAGKKSDIPLLANDILFVPTSGKKAATIRAVEALIQAGTMSVYRW
jgi:polysaccharide export outer membrane protein